MSVSDVRNAFVRVSADGVIDSKDVDVVLQSAGGISPAEERALKEEGDKYRGITEALAQQKLRKLLGEVAQNRRTAASVNREVTEVAPRLTAEVNAKLTPGKATTTYGGTPIPEQVKAVVQAALADGVTPYDVREMDPDPIYSTEHGEPEVDLKGKYNPYAQEQRAVDTLAFDYTELTPEKIEADMNTVQTYNELTGYDTRYGSQVATFKQVTATGNGRITSLYDEASWSDTRARGRGGQKYASNVAILADGSIHAVPASRRSNGERSRILTTASLGRGKLMLFNGHLHMERGVVTYVGMSGRLGKLTEKGEGKFIDPLPLLKAWGFKLAPGLRVVQE